MGEVSVSDKPDCQRSEIPYTGAMLRFLFLISATLLLGASSCAGTDVDDHHHDEKANHESHDGHAGKDHHHKNSPRPYDAEADGWADLNATLDAARVSGKRSIIVMGANWCHDSRGLAFYFENSEFRAENITPYYEQVYIDVGEKNRNIDIAQKFGLEDIKGTPTIFILSSDGEVLNLDTAPTWRNAASRSEEEIIAYFKSFRGE